MTVYPASGSTKIFDLFSVNDIEEASSTVTYIGMEAVDSTWYIKKINTVSGTVFTHATKNNNSSYASYSSAWSNRASLTYESFSNAFS